MPGKNSKKNIIQGVQAVEKVIKQADRIKKIADHINKQPINKIYTVGCGSSYWLGFLLCEFLRDENTDCQPVQASEFYFNPFPIDQNTLVIAFSQSGQTTETIKALRKAKKHKAIAFSIVNRTKSPMSALSEHCYVTPAGKEQLLATKSFDSGLTAAYLFARFYKKTSAKDADKIPHVLTNALSQKLESVIGLFIDKERAYALGIDSGYGAAGETAVKLGEAALIETLAMPALEISHGPKANINETPVILIANKKELIEIYKSLAYEMVNAGGELLILTPWVKEFASYQTLKLPSNETLSVFAAVKLAQCLAVEIALAKGLDPDKPPTLKKFVKRKM